MIMELDCGNSLIKGRVISAADGSLLASSVTSQAADLAQELLVHGVGKITRCLLVSVRSEEETCALVDVLSSALGVEVSRVCPAKDVAGVTNGYRDQGRLGLDRWLAIIAAYGMWQGPCLIIALGTGVHRRFGCVWGCSPWWLYSARHRAFTWSAGCACTSHPVRGC